MIFQTTLHSVSKTVAEMPSPEKQLSHVTAVAGILGSFFEVLPILLSIIGSLLSIAWFGINIYNHPAVQAWLKARREKKT